MGCGVRHIPNTSDLDVTYGSGSCSLTGKLVSVLCGASL